jgi:hypothetical protein
VLMRLAWVSHVHPLWCFCHWIDTKEKRRKIDSDSFLMFILSFIKESMAKRMRIIILFSSLLFYCMHFECTLFFFSLNNGILTQDA